MHAESKGWEGLVELPLCLVSCSRQEQRNAEVRARLALLRSRLCLLCTLTDPPHSGLSCSPISRPPLVPEQIFDGMLHNRTCPSGISAHF